MSDGGGLRGYRCTDDKGVSEGEGEILWTPTEGWSGGDGWGIAVQMTKERAIVEGYMGRMSFDTTTLKASLLAVLPFPDRTLKRRHADCHRMAPHELCEQGAGPWLSFPVPFFYRP